MDKLDNGSADRPSPILMEIMDKTRKMECGFKNRLDTVIAEMKAVGQKKKRSLKTEPPKRTVKVPLPLIGETAKAAKVELVVLLQLRNVVFEMSSVYGIIIMKYMILWANLSLGKKCLLEAFRSFCEAMSSWITQFDNRDALGLRRLEGTLLELLERQMSQGSG
ncbi:hypothetical protein PI126_g21431 [Phytophthora idaei]|nr:hypothetical protein PI126_g21431 [Phytophthora idaei]